MCGAQSVKVKAKGAAITDGMVTDFLALCNEAFKKTEGANERCIAVTKFATEKYGGVWQVIMMPYGSPSMRGGSVKWVEDKYLYLDNEVGKFQLWIWKTA